MPAGVIKSATIVVKISSVITTVGTSTAMKIAIFTGNVNAAQGDMTLRSDLLRPRGVDRTTGFELIGMVIASAFMLVAAWALRHADVVALARRALGTRKVGHGGTLDPFATGLLVILAGRGTRLLQFVPSEPKVYEATIRFGAETDSDDVTGHVVREAPLPAPTAATAVATSRALPC